MQKQLINSQTGVDVEFADDPCDDSERYFTIAIAYPNYLLLRAYGRPSEWECVVWDAITETARLLGAIQPETRVPVADNQQELIELEL